MLLISKCKEEIRENKNHFAKKIIVYPERLEKDENFNFDIGLVKLDRYVKFTADIAPICIEGMISGFKPKSDAVFISGFGMTLYKKGKKAEMPECSTNQFLPRPFHTCKVRKHKVKNPFKTHKISCCYSKRILLNLSRNFSNEIA